MTSKRNTQRKVKPNRSFLSALAQDAGAVLMRYYRKKHRIKTKEGAGIVTEADTAAENVITKKILKFFPNCSMITEETGKYAGSPDLEWIIDPLDGTTNYAHGFPYFCVSIGLRESGQLKRGVIFNPVANELFYAEKGKGAWLNGKRVQVSRTKKLASSLLGTGFYYSKGKKLIEEVELFRRLNETALGVRRPGSAALDLAYVACGRYDGFWERGLNCWDVAAGFLLVTEAGGKLSNYRGKKTDLFEEEVLASNHHLHSAMVSTLDL